MKKIIAMVLAALMSVCCFTVYAADEAAEEGMLYLPEGTGTFEYTSSGESVVFERKIYISEKNTDIKVNIEASDADHDIEFTLLGADGEIVYSRELTVLTGVETQFQIPFYSLKHDVEYTMKITPQTGAGSGTFTVSGIALDEDVRDEAYRTAILRELSTLDVYTNFAKKDTVTRGEAARAIATLASLESKDGESAFVDVSSNENAGYINALCEAGVVKGSGDGIFEPDRAITYEEAVTMLVRALGWEAAAEQSGGYPTGYLKIAAASKTGITKGVSGSVGESVSGEKLIELMYNSLDAEKLTETSETDEASEWTVSESDTFRAALTKTE